MPVLINFLGRNQFENFVAVKLFKPSDIHIMFYQSNPKMIALEKKYYKLDTKTPIYTVQYNFDNEGSGRDLVDKLVGISKDNKLILHITNLNQRYFALIHQILCSGGDIDYCFIKQNKLYYYSPDGNGGYALQIRDCTSIIEDTEIETFFGIYDKTLTYDIDIDSNKVAIVRELATMDPSLNIFETMKTSGPKFQNYSRFNLPKYDNEFKASIDRILRKHNVGYADSSAMFILSSLENFFKGMWLEFFLYDILSQDKGLSNLYRNLKIRDSDGYDNELDIVCTYKGRLKIISCKTLKSDNQKDVNTKLSKYLEDIHSRRDSIHMDVQSFIAVALPKKEIPDGIWARANDDKIGIITVEDFKNISEIIKRD